MLSQAAAAQPLQDWHGVPVSDRYARPVSRGHLPAEVHEASGLAIFGGDRPTLWVHNDSGDLARLYAVDPDGRLLTTVLLDSIVAIDWEDMARGPCSAADEQRRCLYVGDIGDNYRLRASVSIHRLVAPPTSAPFVRLDSGVQTLRLAYPDGPRDAEALVVDEQGRVFILSKEGDGTFGLYGSDFRDYPEDVTQLTAYGRFNLGFLPGGARTAVTAADFDAGERRLLVRTYNAALEYRLRPGQGLAELRGSPFQIVPTALEPQGEAIAYGPNGYWHVSEGERPPLRHARRVEVAPGP